jgi:hypothetical protein
MQHNLPDLLKRWGAVALVAAPMVCMLAFYLWYAQHAWFYQDDFFFIHDYEHNLQVQQWISHENFGRFLSRNFYWWSLLQAFGRHAQAFFLVNLALMAGTSCLLYLLLRKTSEHAALAAGAFYFCCAPSIGNYSWICNSQHILAHFLILAYLLQVRRWDTTQSPLMAITMSLTFLMAISANILAIVALLYPAILISRARASNHSWTLRLVTGIQALSALVLLKVIRANDAGPYSTAWQLDTIHENITFYFGSLWFFLAACGLLAYHAWQRWQEGDSLATWLLLSGPAFIVPFLPLSHQRYLNYAALSHTLLLAGLILAVLKLPLKVLTAALLSLFLLQSVQQVLDQKSYFSSNQRGVKEHAILGATQSLLEDLSPPDGARICVSQHGESHANQAPLPLFWWGLAFGQAFKVYVSDRFHYQLQGEAADCDLRLMLEPLTLAPALPRLAP